MNPGPSLRCYAAHLLRLGQLAALFGGDGVAAVLRRLTCVWVSHLHADHHLGLARLLGAVTALRARGDQPPLLIVGPRGLGLWLATYTALLPARAAPRFRFRSCRDANAPRCAERQWLLRGSGLGLTGFESVPVSSM